MGKFSEMDMQMREAAEFWTSAHDEQIGGNHYRSKSIQPWTYMESIMSEAEFTGYLWGNVIKYMSRWQDKGGVQDLEKANHYLLKLIQHAS
jgi:hypothetical protein